MKHTIIPDESAANPIVQGTFPIRDDDQPLSLAQRSVATHQRTKTLASSTDETPVDNPSRTPIAPVRGAYGAEDDTTADFRPPEMQGEQSVSGDMPTPDSDDDVMANANAMGIGLDGDEEHPQPLDIASDIEKGETYIHSRKD